MITRNNPQIIHGLISLNDKKDHVHVELIESSPFNIGENKIYRGVPGNLFAYACMKSFEKGYKGVIAFYAKNNLINHYKKTLKCNTNWTGKFIGYR